MKRSMISIVVLKIKINPSRSNNNTKIPIFSNNNKQKFRKSPLNYNKNNSPENNSTNNRSLKSRSSTTKISYKTKINKPIRVIRPTRVIRLNRLTNLNRFSKPKDNNIIKTC